MPFGYHLMLDLYDCDTEAVKSLAICYKFLEELPALIGMHKQSPPFIFYSDEIKFPDKAGLSGWVPLIESGISIHTLTVTNFVSIDVYTCRPLDRELLSLVKGFTMNVFQAKEVEEKFLLRGEKYQTLAPIDCNGGFECQTMTGKYEVSQILKVEDMDKIQALYQLYERCFESETLHAQLQRCYDEDAFSNALLDNEYYKFLLTLGNETIGLCLLTKNLSKACIAYVNPKRLEALYAAYHGRIFYVTFIGIAPSHRKGAAFSLLLSAAIKFVDKAQGICGFDFAREANHGLPKLILRTIALMNSQRELQTEAVYEPFGAQEYGVIRPR